MILGFSHPIYQVLKVIKDYVGKVGKAGWLKQKVLLDSGEEEVKKPSCQTQTSKEAGEGVDDAWSHDL